MFYDSKMDDGVFAVADSAITTRQGKTTLLNGFRKVHEIRAKTWKPNFVPDADTEFGTLPTNTQITPF